MGAGVGTGAAPSKSSEKKQARRRENELKKEKKKEQQNSAVAANGNEAGPPSVEGQSPPSPADAVAEVDAAPSPPKYPVYSLSQDDIDRVEARLAWAGAVSADMHRRLYRTPLSLEEQVLMRQWSEAEGKGNESRTHTSTAAGPSPPSSVEPGVTINTVIMVSATAFIVGALVSKYLLRR